ncbi:MAG TPA: hypothetical protein VEH30_02035, partial [Terriglobales bacterium]|nr:hypothetical protein [Terriglobales bacterium]
FMASDHMCTVSDTTTFLGRLKMNITLYLPGKPVGLFVFLGSPSGKIGTIVMRAFSPRKFMTGTL